MKLTTTKVTQLTITDAPSPPNRGVLDPIRVIMQDYGAGRGSLLVACFDSAWVAYWGAMGNNDVRSFVLGCDAGYVAQNLIRSKNTSKSREAERYLTRIVGTIQEALRQQAPRQTPERRAREARVAHANALIKVISDHDRRFFWNSANGVVARLELDASGRLWWIDEYQGARVYTGRIAGLGHNWRGFSHGGTLRSLVEDMRTYVLTGKPVDRWKIGQNCWGYTSDAAAGVREAAFKLPIMKEA